MRSRCLRGITAGFLGTVVLSGFMVLKQKLNLHPEVDPLNDWLVVLSMVAGEGLSKAVAWAAHFVLGSLVWGALYPLIAPYLPANTWIKGLLFGMAAWLLMMVTFFPLAGHGLFGHSLQAGPAPAVMTLALHLIFGTVVSLIFSALMGRTSFDASLKKSA